MAVRRLERVEVLDIDRIRALETKARDRERIGPAPWPARPALRPRPSQVVRWLRQHVPSFRIVPWHRRVIDVLYGEDPPSQVVVSLPRGNGKTTLAAALSVYELLGRGLPGAQILMLATNENQATICLDQALTFIRRSEVLASWSERKNQASLERRIVPQLGAVMMVLPVKDASSLQGWTPTFAVVDEMGFVPDTVWTAMQHAVVKRPEARVLGVSTPGIDRNGTMYRLRTLYREQRPAGLAYLEWSAPEGCALDDRQAWVSANPGLRGGIKPDRMAEIIGTAHEDDFRRYQLGQWVSRRSQWLPLAAWEQLQRAPAPEPGEAVVLGFDGSASHDATALCWATRNAVGVVQVWERIDEPGWRVDRRAVVEAMLAAFERWDVRLLACDPAGWRSEIEEIEREVGERVHRVQFSRPSEFAPACDRFYEAVMAGNLAWDGTSVLRRHLGNAMPEPTRYGTAIGKAYPSSSDHIDAAVAAILAYEWASRLLQPEKPFDARAVIG